MLGQPNLEAANTPATDDAITVAIWGALSIKDPAKSYDSFFYFFFFFEFNYIKLLRCSIKYEK